MKLGLGTVQYGTSYGVTNVIGQTSTTEVRKILEVGRRFGVDIIDTAAAYGDSEQVLGDTLDNDYPYKIVTKTPDWKGQPPEDAANRIRESFERSLCLLKRKAVYGVLVHNVEDLNSKQGDAIRIALEALKERQLTQKIGVSIYTGEQVDRVLAKWRPDIVQLQLNVLDQRFIKSGHLQRLQSSDVLVHVRSVFLQGVLLVDPQRLPEHLSALQAPLSAFQVASRRAGLTPLRAALAFVRDTRDVDTVVIGATTADEFEAAAEAFSDTRQAKLDWASFAVDDDTLVDPRVW